MEEDVLEIEKKRLEKSYKDLVTKDKNEEEIKELNEKINKHNFEKSPVGKIISFIKKQIK